MSRFVVYDCDVGTDDAWGLLILIKGEQSKNSGPESNGYKILAVTTVQGNSTVDCCTTNTLRLLDAADRLDIPVYKGCAKPMLPRNWQHSNFHGLDGFGDVKFDNEIDQKLVQSEHAVNAMYRLACEHPKMVDFILVGPMTNFAMCIAMYGEDFLNKLGHIYVMGGNYRGKGNVTKSAEYNFMCDPEAANIVLENIREPLVILPWETCIDGELGLTPDWRFKVLGANEDCKTVQLMNKIERKLVLPKGFVKWVVCDAMLAAAYVFPKLMIARSRLYHATVELTGTHTRGQMVLDHKRAQDDNVLIIMEIHKDHYRDTLLWTVGANDAQPNAEIHSF